MKPEWRVRVQPIMITLVEDIMITEADAAEILIKPKLYTTAPF
jgi:hypothetical protein